MQATEGEGLRRLVSGESDVHCGGIAAGEPLAVELGAGRHATGTLSRCAAEDWEPFRHLHARVREVALERLR